VGSQILDGAAKAFDNDDYVDVVIHSYRHRVGLAPGSPIRLDTLSAHPWFPVWGPETRFAFKLDRLSILRAGMGGIRFASGTSIESRLLRVDASGTR
jgi:hypothetical protein